ncbi:Immunoglobulin G-binding protein A precursor [Planctomycetes bacterium Pan216]|uniref:Immunoglobulin G-binding protein A n=1 Tax=Kolteria novifilia TaxID=2527975 RepID=A0A518AYD8_9BACT|nr:Immunoglobulin G-binding protein A precursor [Planctomycetes bacterium Pan216]
MKSEERHQLQENELSAILYRYGIALRPYVPFVLGGLAVIFVVATIVTVMARSQQRTVDDAWDEFFAAEDAGQFEIVAERYAGTPVVAYAKLRVADFEYEEGLSQLFGDRAAATSKLEDALSLYQGLAGLGSSHPEVARQAGFGIGMTYETLGDLEKAKSAYEQVVSRYPGSEEAFLSGMRLERIETPTAKEFYAEFASYEPKEPSTELPPDASIPLPPMTSETPAPPLPSSTEKAKDDAKVPSPKTPAKESSKTPAKESPKTPAKESSKTPAKESPKTPAKEASKTPAKESPKTPAKEASKTPAKESPKTPAKQTPEPKGKAAAPKTDAKPTAPAKEKADAKGDAGKAGE